MKTNPFYSANVADPDVYHTQSMCPSGKAIPKDNKRFGTNGYKPCRSCAEIA
jgi:hypothetical protein